MFLHLAGLPPKYPSFPPQITGFFLILFTLTRLAHRLLLHGHHFLRHLHEIQITDTLLSQAKKEK